MSELQPNPYDEVARKWLALMERRRAHFVELCNSGRWKHYYSQAELREEMRKVISARDQWAINAGLAPPEDNISVVLRVPPRIVGPKTLT
jgi:hypothetical protein